VPLPKWQGHFSLSKKVRKSNWHNNLYLLQRKQNMREYVLGKNTRLVQLIKAFLHLGGGKFLAADAEGGAGAA